MIHKCSSNKNCVNKQPLTLYLLPLKQQILMALFRNRFTFTLYTFPFPFTLSLDKSRISRRLHSFLFFVFPFLLFSRASFLLILLGVIRAEKLFFLALFPDSSSSPSSPPHSSFLTLKTLLLPTKNYARYFLHLISSSAI